MKPTQHWEWLAVYAGKPEWVELVISIQRDLYRMMSEVAASPENIDSFESITSENVTWLEDQIASLEAGTEVPRQFIIPGDNPSAAALDVARTVVRRAERRAAEMFHAGLIQNIHILEYLNRLSSFCFLLELATIQSNGKDAPTLAKTS